MCSGDQIKFKCLMLYTFRSLIKEHKTLVSVTKGLYPSVNYKFALKKKNILNLHDNQQKQLNL